MKSIRASVFALCFFGSAFFCAGAEGESVLGAQKNFAGEDAREERSVAAVAEECGRAVLTGDKERLEELSASEGFEHENAAARLYFMGHYRQTGSDNLMISATDIEVVAVRLLEGKKEALVSVRAVFSAASQDGLSSAPFIETWKFIKKDGKWVLSIRETPAGLTRLTFYGNPIKGK